MEVVYSPEFYLYLTATDQTVSPEAAASYTESIPDWVKNANPENLRPDLSSEILISQN